MCGHAMVLRLFVFAQCPGIDICGHIHLEFHNIYMNKPFIGPPVSVAHWKVNINSNCYESSPS